MSLERFHRAQEKLHGGFATALSEIAQGEKSSHWIWYVFPQIEGLGRSSMAREYALHGLAETMEYLRDPVLCARYLQIAQAVAGQLARDVSLARLMGSDIDALKLVSSLTLFRAAAQRVAAEDNDSAAAEIAQVAEAILPRAAAEGYPACAATMVQISKT